MLRKEWKAEDKARKAGHKAEEKARKAAEKAQEREAARAQYEAIQEQVAASRFDKFTAEKGYREDLVRAMFAAEKAGSVFVGMGRALAKASELIPAEESVEEVLAVQYAGGSGIAVLTDTRLVAIRDDLSKQKVESLWRADITSASWSSGLLGGVAIQAGTKKVKLGYVNEKQGLTLAETLNAGLSSATPTATPADRLRALDDLLAQGLITEDEHAARRSAVLDAL